MYGWQLSSFDEGWGMKGVKFGGWRGRVRSWGMCREWRGCWRLNQWGIWGLRPNGGTSWWVQIFIIPQSDLQNKVWMGYSDVAEVVLHVIIVAWEDQRLSTSLSFCLCLLPFFCFWLVCSSKTLPKLHMPPPPLSPSFLTHVWIISMKYFWVLFCFHMTVESIQLLFVYYSYSLMIS